MIFASRPADWKYNLFCAHWSDVRIYSLTIAELWANRIKQQSFRGQTIRYTHHRGSNVS